MNGETAYGISTILVLPWDATWEPRGQQGSHQLGGLYRKMQRRVPVAILADTVVFVACFDEELLVSNRLSAFPALSFAEERSEVGASGAYGDFEQAQLGG